MRRDDIHIALDDDARVGAANVGMGEMKSVEGVALVENGGACGVDILRVVALRCRRGIAHIAAAETYRIALPIVYGKHQPAAEEVPGSAGVIAID